MKRITLISLIFLCSGSAWALSADFSGYMRGGTGTQFEGGKQECFYNAGIPGNFMRLGNECSFYGELGFTFHHKIAEPGDSSYFRTQTRLMLGSQGTRQWESASKRDINQIEAFVQAGGLTETPMEFWVGKRFYRDVDAHIFDLYYYADMSGVGGGVENWKMPVGSLSIAHLMQTKEILDSADETNAGAPQLHVLDVRWKDIELNSTHKLNFWSAFGGARSSQDSTNTYVDTHGLVFATRLQSTLSIGNNNLSLMYGQGALRDFNIYGTSTLEQSEDYLNRASSIRLVEDFHHDISDNWGLLFSLAAQYQDLQRPDGAKIQWQMIGVRPVYAVSDHVQILFEAGYSRIKDETQLVDGDPVGERELYRVSIAPQISFKRSIWGRPVLRAYLAHSMWNDANKSSIADSAPTFANQTAGTNFGYQYEAWF